MESIHGHEVMQMMIDSSESFTKESLETAIISKFGTDARFHTCSAENLTPRELVDFLESRGKFTDTDEGEGFKTSPEQICDH